MLFPYGKDDGLCEPILKVGTHEWSPGRQGRKGESANDPPGHTGWEGELVRFIEKQQDCLRNPPHKDPRFPSSNVRPGLYQYGPQIPPSSASLAWSMNRGQRTFSSEPTNLFPSSFAISPSTPDGRIWLDIAALGNELRRCQILWSRDGEIWGVYDSWFRVTGSCNAYSPIAVWMSLWDLPAKRALTKCCPGLSRWNCEAWGGPQLTTWMLSLRFFHICSIPAECCLCLSLLCRNDTSTSTTYHIDKQWLWCMRYEWLHWYASCYSS